MAEQAARLTVRDRSGVSLVEFSDRKILDEMCIHEIQDELTKLVDGPAGDLVLSFRNVEHLSSAALGMLITLKKRIEDKKVGDPPRQGRLKLSDINPQIYEVFKITRLNKLFDIHPNVDRALAAFA